MNEPLDISNSYKFCTINIIIGWRNLEVVKNIIELVNYSSRLYIYQIIQFK